MPIPRNGGVHTRAGTPGSEARASSMIQSIYILSITPSNRTSNDINFVPPTQYPILLTWGQTTSPEALTAARIRTSAG